MTRFFSQKPKYQDLGISINQDKNLFKSYTSLPSRELNNHKFRYLRGYGFLTFCYYYKVTLHKEKRYVTKWTPFYNLCIFDTIFIFQSGAFPYVEYLISSNKPKKPLNLLLFFGEHEIKKEVFC